MKEHFSIYLLLVLLLVACQTKEEIPENPFDKYKEDSALEPSESTFLEAGSFAKIHRDIFKPTCANAGCHDGHFEPDFRTLESSYNTLVYHPVIKNDVSGSFEARVVPFEPLKSVLWERLNRDIDGQSGIMPLAYDPDSDWPEMRESYLAEIKSWIEGGAKDIFGNVAEAGELKPYVRGLLSKELASNAPFSRDGGNGSMLIPQDIEELTLWMSISDDSQLASSINSKLYLSTDIDTYPDQNGVSMETHSQYAGESFDGELISFGHSAEVRLDSFNVGERIFIHVKLRDPSGGESIWIPGKDSPDYIKELFSLKRF